MRPKICEVFDTNEDVTFNLFISICYIIPILTNGKQSWKKNSLWHNKPSLNCVCKVTKCQ